MSSLTRRFSLLVSAALVAAGAPLATASAPAAGGGGHGAIGFGTPTIAFQRGSGFSYEPSVAVDHLGRVFVTDALGDQVGVSTDGGGHFASRPAPSAPVGAQLVTGDAIVQIDPQGHLVYSQIFATGIQVAVSSDGARSWDSNTIIGTGAATYAPAPDRQWVGFGPGNAVYASWRTGNLYWTATSSDGARSFAPPQPFLPGTSIFSVGLPVTDRSGRVYVPVLVMKGSGSASPAVAVSQRGVATGAFLLQQISNDQADFFPIAAIDAAGNTAVTWRGANGSDRVARVARSTDHGKTWSQPVVWGSGLVTSSPWISFRGGRADVLWYGVTHAGVGSHLMLTRGTPDGRTLQEAVVVPQISSPGGTFSRTEANTDYANLAYLRDGRVIAAWTAGGVVYVSAELPTRR